MISAFFNLSGIFILRWIYGESYKDKCKFPDGLLSLITVFWFVALVILFASKDSSVTDYITGASILVAYPVLLFVWRIVVRRKFANDLGSIDTNSAPNNNEPLNCKVINTREESNSSKNSAADIYDSSKKETEQQRTITSPKSETVTSEQIFSETGEKAKAETSAYQEKINSQPIVNESSTAKVKYCYKCGAKLFEGSLFCSMCGTKVWVGDKE